MKIVVSGASGFVGGELIPLLVAAGASVTAAGRDPARLEAMFPACRVIGYDDFAAAVAAADLVVNLAVANSNSALTEAAVEAVNVDFALKIAEMAQSGGARRFLNVSSVHALDHRNMSAYAKSKRKADERLRASVNSHIDSPQVVSVYLAAVDAGHFAGRLNVLNRLPRALGRLAFTVVSAIKPTVNIQTIADYVLALAHTSGPQEDCILADDKGRNPVYRFVRRALDVSAGAAILVAGFPVLFLVWLAIRLESPGPGVFSQTRVGRDGRHFVCYKFRTMRDGTRQAGTHEIPAASVTRFGGFLRHTKLDELPQAVNLLRNEMSLIGPRPCLPAQQEVIDARARRGVLSIKPGITGLAQINAVDMSTPERLAQWDARYMHLRGLMLDLRILIATAFGVGNGDRTAR